MRRLVLALAASAALAITGAGAVATQAHAATTGSAFNVDNSALYIHQGSEDDLVFSSPNAKTSDTFVFHFSKASLKGVTITGDTSGECNTTKFATTITCHPDFAGTFNASFGFTVSSTAAQDSLLGTVTKNGSTLSGVKGYVYTGRVADLSADYALPSIVYPQSNGTLQGGGLTVTVPNNGEQSTAALVTLQAINQVKLTAKPKGLDCPTFSSGTIVCRLQNVPANSDNVKITFPIVFTTGETHTIALRFTTVGAWDSNPADNIPHVQGDKAGQATYRAPGAVATSTPTPTGTPTKPTATATTTSTASTAPTTSTSPTSSVSLPTNVPAGVAGPTNGNGGSSMGGPIALGAGILGLLMVGAAALRRRGSHQA